LSGSGRPGYLGSMDGPKITKIGPYELEIPDFWSSITVREKPPLYVSNSVVGPGVSFDFAVLEGVGDNPAERAHMEAALLDGYGAQKVTPLDETFHGLHYQGHRLEQVHALGPGAIHEMYFVVAYGDLLHFAYSIGNAIPEEDTLRHLFFTMVESAIVRRGYAIVNEQN